MRIVRTLALVGIVGGALVAIGLGSTALAGKAKKASDPTDKPGNLLAANIYKNCDIKKLTAQGKGKKLQVTVALRGNQSKTGATTLNLNTKGGKKSVPEFQVTNAARIVDTGGDVNDNGLGVNQKEVGVANMKKKKGAKEIQFTVPLKKIGKPKKTGVQAATCGGGAVDIAPGGSHFDDTSFTGRPAYKYLNVKTN